MPALCQDSWGIVSINPRTAWDGSAVFIPVFKEETAQVCPLSSYPCPSSQKRPPQRGSRHPELVESTPVETTMGSVKEIRPNPPRFVIPQSNPVRMCV